MMIRFLFFVAVCAGIYFLWLHIQKLRNQQARSPTDNAEPMVKCHYCHVYSPQKTATKGADGNWYCCLAHEQQARK